jgi:hypothetical protein
MSQISVNHTDMNAIFLHRQYHTGLVAVILPCSYAGIKDDHMGLGADILHCQYAEISVNYIWVWVQQFLIVIMQKSLLNFKHLGAAILYCQYAEISIYVKGWTFSIFRHNSKHKVITNKE